MSLFIIDLAAYGSIACAIASLIYLFFSKKLGINSDPVMHEQKEDEVSRKLRTHTLHFLAPIRNPRPAPEFDISEKSDNDLITPYNDLFYDNPRIQQEIEALVLQSRNAVLNANNFDEAVYLSASVDKKIFRIIERDHSLMLRRFTNTENNINRIYELELINSIVKDDLTDNERYINLTKFITETLQELKSQTK